MERTSSFRSELDFINQSRAPFTIFKKGVFFFTIALLSHIYQQFFPEVVLLTNNIHFTKIILL